MTEVFQKSKSTALWLSVHLGSLESLNPSTSTLDPFCLHRRQSHGLSFLDVSPFSDLQSSLRELIRRLVTSRTNILFSVTRSPFWRPRWSPLLWPLSVTILITNKGDRSYFSNIKYPMTRLLSYSTTESPPLLIGVAFESEGFRYGFF